MNRNPPKNRVYAICNGHVIDPANNLSGRCNIFIENGNISEVSRRTPPAGVEKIDAIGLIVTPGFIDLHTHLREPGFEYKEDIESGSKAAAAGGYTTIFCMPNTNPVNDNIDTTKYIIGRGEGVGLVNVIPVGAISAEIKGKKLSDIEGMAGEGILAISDDGNSIQDEDLMLKGMEVAKSKRLLTISHPEDRSISKDGVMNAGRLALKLGLPCIPREAENSFIERDLRLSKESGARLHIAHISTKEGIESVRRAKKERVKVTCEVTPHHLLLTEEAVEDLNPNTKMNPPLRTDVDREALIKGILDGTVDAVATDHAPHSSREKGLGGKGREVFLSSLPGVIGMETALPVLIKLFDEKKIKIEKLIELLTIGPARVLGIKAGTLSEGAKGDVTIFDPNESYQIDRTKFLSKARNTPFEGWKVKGRVIHTIVGGRLVR